MKDSLDTGVTNPKDLPFSVNEQELQFSPGKHNELQKNIPERFIPQFAPDAKCLYVGDSADRALVFDWPSPR